MTHDMMIDSCKKLVIKSTKKPLASLTIKTASAKYKFTFLKENKPLYNKKFEF
jgi:hypothetical protein